MLELAPNFILAILPILWLLIALAALKMAAHKAMAITFAIAFVEAVVYWQLPAICALTASVEGVLNALWPICLVIIAALFIYNVTVRTGAMETIKSILVSVSSDQRVLALLIAWGFGNFLEGMAGFGTPVAIPAAILAGIGVNPILAVVGCLIVNTAPTAFGSVGIPTTTLNAVTGIDPIALSGSIASLQLITALISPFFLIMVVGGGLKGLKGMIPITLVASLSFVIPYFAIAQFMGPELPDILGSIISMVCIVAAAKIFNKTTPEGYAITSSSDFVLNVAEGVKAWLPFILVAVFLLLSSNLCPPIHDPLAAIKSTLVVYAGEGANTLGFSWINTPGIWILLSAVIGGMMQGASFGVLFDVMKETLVKYWKTILTICLVLATAKIMGYAGMIADIAAFLVVVTGPLYPVIAPLIGALGAFITGSATNTSVLFGGLQAQTAAGLSLNEAWIAGANLFGAGIGKMIAPQNLAVGAAAVGLSGEESKILKAVLPYFILYIVLAGVITMAGSMMGL